MGIKPIRSILFLITVLPGAALGSTVSLPGEGPQCRIECLTSGPMHHFFGYYGITPWNQSGRYLVCLESDFQDRLPTGDDAATIGLVDAKTGDFRPVATTRAWNLQQGAMLHWNPLNPEHEIIYNDRRNGQIGSTILNLQTMQNRFLHRPVSAVSHNGKYALSMTYGRLQRLRPVVGYGGAADPNPNSPHPANDGIFLLNLLTGEPKLVVSYDDMYRAMVKNHPEIEGVHLWTEHAVFNRDDSRFLFLARCNLPLANGNSQMETGMFTCRIDGRELREVIPFGTSVSHFDWRNACEILATFKWGGGDRQHYLFTDGLGNYRQMGKGFLVGDGHCTFTPDGKWFATDRNYSSTAEKGLMIFNPESGSGKMLGKFKVGKYLGGDTRCDLHPRWNRTGDAICFDAIANDGTRQLHVAHLMWE